MPAISVPIELGGATRHLRYSFNALCLLEDTLGLPIADIGAALAGSVKLGTVRALLYAGLSDEDDALTLKDVGDLLESNRLGEYAEAIRKAFEGAFASESGDEKKG
jgi:hypothetical protein